MEKENKKEIRCGHCNKLLGKGTVVDVEIKCPRCKKLNFLRDICISNSEPQTAKGLYDLVTHAYYNENDPFAASWLRELIKSGHIAPGEVGERSIEDVLPSDLAGFCQCHFFAGIAVWSYALRQAG